MERKAFVASLAATVAAVEATHPTAALALDEAALGQMVFADLRESGEILFNSPYYEHLNEVGSVISGTVKSRYPFPVRFYIVKGDTANAFSVPGGNIYVNEPLLDLAKNRDQLAGVLGHETGHMVLHHVAKRIDNSKKAGTLATLGSILARVLMGPLAGAGAEFTLQNLYAGQDANLSRHIEAQADEEGARIVAATNVYNPYGMVWFFERMSATYGPGKAGYFTSHPLDAQRIADLKRLFAQDVATFGKFADSQQRDVAYW